MASIMKLPVKATVRDMVRICLEKLLVQLNQTLLIKLEALAASGE